MTNTQQQRARNVGSNYTTFRWAGQSIAYLEAIDDSGQRPVAGAQEIHPLGYRNPTEFVVARAIRGGTLALTIRELWHQEIWQQLSGLANSTDIVDVFNAVARMNNPITCTKIITPPRGQRYGKTYHGCVIGDIQDGERIDITQLSTAKAITVMYTHTTRL